MDIACITPKIDNSGRIGLAERLSQHDGRIIDRPDSPLIESRLVGWRSCKGLHGEPRESVHTPEEQKKGKRAYVVHHVLATNMQHPVCKIGPSHLHPIIHPPQSCSEAVANSGEATARSCVGLEHDERFASSSCETARILVRGNKIDSRPVRDIAPEHLLRNDGRGVTISAKRRHAIVIGVAKSRRENLER